jgi:hypothetical protein
VEARKLAILGIGSLRCGHPIVSSLATYFGERRLAIHFFDADPERLDLYDLLARSLFQFNKATHELTSTEDPAEVLEEADAVILALGDNCARKYRGLPRGKSADKLELAQELLENVPPGVPVLSLLAAEAKLDREDTWNLAWPPELTDPERAAIPHQILRYLRGDEYPYPWFQEYGQTPLKTWLDNPAALPLK